MQKKTWGSWNMNFTTLDVSLRWSFNWCISPRLWCLMVFASAAQTLCTLNPGKRITESQMDEVWACQNLLFIWETMEHSKNKPSPRGGCCWVYWFSHINIFGGTSSNRHPSSRSQRRRQSPAGAELVAQRNPTWPSNMINMLRMVSKGDFYIQLISNIL